MRAGILDRNYSEEAVPKRFAKVSGAPADLIATLPSYISGMGTDPNQWWRSATAAAVKRSGTGGD